MRIELVEKGNIELNLCETVLFITLFIFSLLGSQFLFRFFLPILAKRQQTFGY